MYNVDETQLIRSITRDSFFEFLKEFWETIIPETPVWNWHIEYLCNQLQEIAERVFRDEPLKHDLVINVPPGTTKSTIVSIMFPAWVWTRMPSARFICGSFAEDLAMDLSRKCRNVIRSELYASCFPEVKLSDDQDTKHYFENTKRGSRYCIGTGGDTIGRHAHFILVDDPVNPGATLSKVELDNTNIWMGETLSQRKVDKRVTVTVLVMQRLHQNDPTGHMLSLGRPVKHICLPAEESTLVNPPELRAKYKDGLLDPLRLNRKVLADALKVLFRVGYAGQYDQNPIPRGGGTFDISKLRIGAIRPSRFQRIVRYWDKAGTSKGGAFTVGVKMGYVDEKNIWVLDVVRGQWAFNDREAVIVQTAKLDGKGVKIGVEQEPGSAGLESYERTAKRLFGYHTRPDKVTGDKENRAGEFAVYLNDGRVFVPEGVPWLVDYLDELRYFPKSKYMDQVDASSGAFNMLTKARRVVGALGSM